MVKTQFVINVEVIYTTYTHYRNILGESFLYTFRIWLCFKSFKFKNNSDYGFYFWSKKYLITIVLFIPSVVHPLTFSIYSALIVARGGP